MKKQYGKIIFAVLGVLIVGGIFYVTNKQSVPADEENSAVTEADIRGCYIATLAKDVYTLKITEQSEEKVQGNLWFKNFEKDSSRGTFVGTYADGILLGDYSFQSEGMFSVMQVIFKKTPEGFIRGYGDVNAEGTRFVDTNAVTYDTNAVFKTTADCPIK